MNAVHGGREFHVHGPNIKDTRAKGFPSLVHTVILCDIYVPRVKPLKISENGGGH